MRYPQVDMVCLGVHDKVHHINYTCTLDSYLQSQTESRQTRLWHLQTSGRNKGSNKCNSQLSTSNCYSVTMTMTTTTTTCTATTTMATLMIWWWWWWCWWYNGYGDNEYEYDDDDDDDNEDNDNYMYNHDDDRLYNCHYYSVGVTVTVL